MRTALLAITACLLGAAACDSGDTPAAVPGVASSPVVTTASQQAPSNSAQASSAAIDTGLPPKPAPATVAKYIAALNAIDPEIVNGKVDKAVSRGMSQCVSIKLTKADRAKLVQVTNSRFISPNHPEGFGTTTAEQILDVVHANLCPSY
ncbi:hypothetical protein [Kitasatospora sp. NPDC085879]|uniref:hypothetical protein n=1 Tax=Kitasatospora sp. NPDC085879 TaxID=3154769 RepID=UPI0034265866